MKNREQREFKKYLKSLVGACQQFEDAMDVLMLEPYTAERGKKVARLLNALGMAKDSARHFGLGESLKQKHKP